jgi:membrane-associated phospholipid phosphatase
MQPIDQHIAARILLGTVGAAYVSMIVILSASDISFDFDSAGLLARFVAVLAMFLAYASWRKMIVFPTVFGCLIAMFVSSVPILTWTYGAMNLNLPLADVELVGMDEALGFDWRAFIGFVDSRPMLARLLADAYSSFFVQLLFLPILLALFRREQRAFAMIFAYYLLCAVSALVSIWYPALGTYVVYGVEADSLANINTKFGYFFLEQFHAIREAGPFVLRLDESAGIVTFPSVHAGVAALCAWAAWDVKWLRYPFALLNVAMAASAISHANHYLADVIAGVAIAGLCASVATLVFYRKAEAQVRVAVVTQPSPAAM